MRVLIVGNGQVGRGLRESLQDVQVLDWNGRLEELSSGLLRELSPDAVINAAGKTDLAWCENNPREAFRINVEAAYALYESILWMDSDCRFIHFSSGCIWDGPYDASGQPFGPDAPPSPASFYAWTKAAADALLLERDPTRVAILRPRQVYSDSSSPRNTLNKLLRYPKLIDSPNSMSSLDVIVKCVAHCLHSQDWTGKWNVYDNGFTSPYSIGMMLAAAGLRGEPLRIEKSELDTWHSPRRVDTVIYDERFERLIQPRDVEVVLQESIDNLTVTAQPS